MQTMIRNPDASPLSGDHVRFKPTNVLGEQYAPVSFDRQLTVADVTSALVRKMELSNDSAWGLCLERTGDPFADDASIGNVLGQTDELESVVVMPKAHLGGHAPRV